MREVLNRWLDATRERLRERSRSAAAWMVRLTAAAVASFVVASLVFPRSAPLLAPLTALLVVQLTPVSILTSGIQRVASVVAGVSVAVAFSALVGLTWWSLGTLIAVSLLIGQLLRLGPNLIEVPISAMLVLRVGSTTAATAAWQRIAETLVGAGVGVLSNLLFPPKVTSRDAAVAIEDLADDLAALLSSAADGLLADESEAGQLAERAMRWLGDARRLTHDMPNVGAALLQAEESRRLNLRALGTADSGPALRHGLEALEHSAVAVRSMFRSIVDAVRGYEAQGRELDADMRGAVALLLRDCAAGLRSFGRLVQAEARGAVEPPDPTELREALDRLREARARVTDLVLIDPRGDTTLAVLNFALLATVERLLQELDPVEHARHQARRAQTLPARLVAQPLREQADLTKQVWRGWRSGGNRS
jgi:uncharacterized membrane protein YccC